MIDTIYYIPWQVRDEVFIRIREVLEQFKYTYNTPSTRSAMEHVIERELQQFLYKGVIKDYSFNKDDMKFQPVLEWVENSVTLVNKFNEEYT